MDQPTTPPETLQDIYNNPTPPALPEKVELIEEPLQFSSLLSNLLKTPLNLIATIHEKRTLPWLPLLLLSIIALSIFGVVIGSFSGSHQLWIAPLKIVTGLSFGALICLPSLYIFCCLSGVDVSFQTVFGLLLCCISLLALLLVGFAPVVWLFSASSSSIIFFGFLCTVLWLVCLGFGFKLISRASRHFGMKTSSHLKVWMFIFALVTLQLPTTLRPIIGESTDGKLINFDEKKFFLTHWGEQFEEPLQQTDSESRSTR